MTSPSDFSLEIHGLPEHVGDGQLLAFIDNIAPEQKIFEDNEN